jgi:hypothetical protein
MDMAREQLHTAADAAKELHDILSSDENLPEWVQSKITKAMDYLDTARDYMKASDQEDDEQGMVPERKLTKGEMGKREKFVKGMKPAKGDFEKRYGDRGEEVMYATATKMAKKKNTKEDAVEETTTAGSVATAPAAAKKVKGMTFGKGVYEGLNSRVENMINESINISVNAGTTESGETLKQITVTAEGDDAEMLAQILKMAGLGGSGHAETCSACGQTPCGCNEEVEEDYSNSPEPQTADTDFMVNKLAGGLNGPKRQVNPNNPADNPLAMKKLNKMPGAQINVSEQTQKRLFDLYKDYKGQ